MGVIGKIKKQVAGFFGSNDIGDVKRQRVRPMRRMGASGTVSYGGFLQNVEDSSAMTGRERYRTFSEIIGNVTIVAAGLRLFINLVSKAQLKYEPADESAEAKRLAELSEEIMGDMETPMPNVMKRAATFPFFGYGLFEWTAKRRDDGVIGMLDLEPRPQVTIERWHTDEHGVVQGVIQRSPQTQAELYIPREKLLYLVDKALNDTPEGLGLLRHVADTARRLKRYEQLEGWAYETDLKGIPVGRAPLEHLDELVEAGKLTQPEADAMVAELEALIEDHVRAVDTGMLLDSATYTTLDEKGTPSQVPLWNVELLKGDSQNHEAIGRTIERLVREIARVMGVEHMLLGSDSAGSFALAKDKSLMFALTVDSTLVDIVHAIRKDVLEPLFELNGWDTKLVPTIKHDVTAHKDIDMIGAALQSIASAGAPLMPHDEAVGEFFDLLGLTRPERDEEDSMIPRVPLPGEEPAEVPEPGAEETPNDPAEMPDEPQEEN